MVLKVTAPFWGQRKLVADVVKRCGPFVSTYRGIRDLESYYSKGWVGLVWDNDMPIGFWVIREGSRNRWTTIHEIGVVPEARRKGYGERMITHLLATSPHKRLRLVCDARNVEGLAFYRDLGFNRLGERFNRAGEAIIDLELCS